jgi:hypothetical protein
MAFAAAPPLTDSPLQRGSPATTFMINMTSGITVFAIASFSRKIAYELFLPSAAFPELVLRKILNRGTACPRQGGREVNGLLKTADKWFYIQT